jgi:hypothetical protein
MLYLIYLIYIYYIYIMEKDKPLSSYSSSKGYGTFFPYNFIPPASTEPATPQEKMNITSATREMLHNREEAFKKSLTKMSQQQRESAIAQKFINDREDKEKARQLLEEKKSATTKAAEARERGRALYEEARERGRALYEEHRQQGEAIVQAEKKRAEEANRSLFESWNRGGKGKRTQRRRKQQRKLKHKRYSSRYKRKSKSRR